MSWPGMMLLCLAATEGSLKELAVRSAETVKPHLRRQTVALYVESDFQRVSETYTTLLIGSLGVPVTILEVETSSEAEKRARERGVDVLVRMKLSIRDGQLHAEGDVLSTWINFWAGQMPTRAPSPAAWVSIHMPLDTETLSLAQTSSHAPGLRIEGAKLLELDEWPSAMSAGDLDQDGHAEIAVLTSQQLTVFNHRGQPLSHGTLALLPDSGIRVREPFGSILVDSKTSRLAVFPSDKSRGAWLRQVNGQWVIDSLLSQVPLSIGPQGLWNSTFVPGRNEWQPLEGLSTPFQALHVQNSLWVVALPGGKAEVYEAKQRLAQIKPAGSAVALWSHRGKPLWVVSSGEYPASRDVLRILDVQQVATESKYSPLWESPSLPGRAVLASTADLDADGQEELLIALWLLNGKSELHVFRNLSP